MRPSESYRKARRAAAKSQAKIAGAAIRAYWSLLPRVTLPLKNSPAKITIIQPLKEDIDA
jgi:hypothetical protein